MSRELGQGSGIGLATVFGIVKQNNGHIFVESQRGKGTRFTIWFPRSTKSRVSEGSQDGESPGSNSRCTILLVEDEEQLRTPLAEYLRQSGYQVFAAASGEEALVVAEQHRNTIDLLVTDLVMPGLGGRELSTRLVQFNPRLKTIYMSGHTDDEVARQDIRQRELAFLQKPFRLAALASMIEKTILPFS